MLRSTFPAAGRRLAALAFAGVVTASVLAAAPAQAEGHRVQARAAVEVSARSAVAGHRVTVRAVVRAGGAPLAHHRVAVQQRTIGTSPWHTLGTGTTSGAGRVAVPTAPLVRSKQFRVRVLGDRVDTVSGVAAVDVPTWVRVTATSPLTPTAGDPVVLAGSTSAQLAGRRIRLQLLVGGVWKTVASSQVFADATYNVHGIATLGGDRQYRAVVAAAPGRAAAISDPVEFTVSAWYRLADLDSAVVATSDRGLVGGRLVIAGTPYEQSVGAALAEGDSGSTTWALDNRCTDLRAVLGAAAGSDVAFTGRWRVFADDDLALERTLTTGAAEQITASITGTSELRLRAFALDGSGVAAWGNAEVLCAGRP